ncbi:MAG TPA: hypothetical protein VIL31_07530 [Cyclobacteriaceae bacterium]
MTIPNRGIPTILITPSLRTTTPSLDGAFIPVEADFMPVREIGC